MRQEFFPVVLKSRGSEVTNARFYPATNGKLGVILVGGIGGDFDTPAKNLYPKLAAKLTSENINALRVQFRYPTDLDESVQDVLAGANFLLKRGVIELGLVGHSFGGAVVIQAAAKLDAVKSVVTLATQSHGTDAVVNLSPHASILLIHGADDKTLSPENSKFVYSLAKEPKKLVILKGNSHGLDESAEEIFILVHDWLKKNLCSRETGKF